MNYSGTKIKETATARRRSAGFQTCCIADFQVGSAVAFGWPADLEIRDTADLEVCATFVAAAPHCAVSICNLQRAGKSETSGRFQRSAGCNSAIRQIENLRYDPSLFRYSRSLIWIDLGPPASGFGFGF